MTPGEYAQKTGEAHAERRAFTKAEIEVVLASPAASRMTELYASALDMTTLGELRADLRQILRDMGIVLPGQERIGDWMQTFTGKQFYPLDPRPEDIDIRDIAHALSMQCRYAGHCLRFYSTAEHSVHLSFAVEPEFRMAALLHDGGEAYLPDMVRPTKRSFPAYTEAEEKIRRMIFVKYGLSPEIPDAVHSVDDRICADEKAQNMAPCEWKHNPEPLGITLKFWTPSLVEKSFLVRFRELGGEL